MRYKPKLLLRFFKPSQRFLNKGGNLFLILHRTPDRFGLFGGDLFTG